MIKDKWPFLAGGLLIAAAILIALLREAPSGGLGATRFEDPATPLDATQPEIVARDAPVVIGFRGDLLLGGNPYGNDGTIVPFVIGDVLKLEADALNATEYRWSVNGQVLADNGQEWSVRKDRDFTIKAKSEYRFAVQVRDQGRVSQARDVLIKTVAIHIVSFEAAIVEEPDRALTGEDYTVAVEVVEPVVADVDFYQFRYRVNDQIVKHPDTDEEWSTEYDFTYIFPVPGQYTFSVEVRRATEKEPEASATLADVIVAADAVVETFNVTPEKYAPIGTLVDLGVFTNSLLGNEECRFGVKRLVAADFEWLPQQDGKTWGRAERDWMPREGGQYLVRAEVRQAGSEQPDDFREILYTVVEGDF